MPRNTKIVCTIGPAVQDPQKLRELILAGMDVARLNFSHGTWDDHARRIATIREQSQLAGKPVAILQDLQGPKIRTGWLKDHKDVRLEEGAPFTITCEDCDGDAHRVSTTYRELPQDVRPGDTILMADGLLEVHVERVEGTDVVTRVVHGGMLGEHKGINLPGVQVSAPSMTEKDREDLEFGIDQGVDYIALSFVRRAGDIYRVKEAISRRGADIPVIAKLEKPEAIGRLEEIVAAADGVMVARGDLAVESSTEHVPILQKEIIRQANRRGRLVITATQMLESMITNPRPTRAEASDVANAVLDGTDAVMLSAETASGRFPIECVRMMDRIVRTAEARYSDFGTPSEPDRIRGVQGAISRAADGLMSDINQIVALAAHTTTGRSALLLSKERPTLPILAFTSEPRVLTRMALFWGVTPLLIQRCGSTDELIDRIERYMVENASVMPGDVIAVCTGSPPGTTSNMLKLHIVGGKTPEPVAVGASDAVLDASE
ncbi:MAG: pyruvate kinase [Chloroflexi bacterium]|nr:pyruvate kinase [Chloroflexota bacterium]